MQSIPLILTLTLEEAVHRHFTDLRNSYFPKYCNYLEAHLTLFHHLPAEALIIEDVVREVCSREPLKLEVTALKNLGNGVAFSIISEELQIMHKFMQNKLDAHLISQDRQKLWPHITIQNKVTAFKAMQTLNFLKNDFKPFTITAIGISSFLYLGGPWEKVQDFQFRKA